MSPKITNSNQWANINGQTSNIDFLLFTVFYWRIFEHSNNFWFASMHKTKIICNTKTQFTRIKWTIIVFLMWINVPYHSHRYVCFGLISLFCFFSRSLSLISYFPILLFIARRLRIEIYFSCSSSTTSFDMVFC